MRSWGLVIIFVCIGFTGVIYADDVLVDDVCALDEYLNVGNATENMEEGPLCRAYDLEGFLEVENIFNEEEQFGALGHFNASSDLPVLGKENTVCPLPADMKRYVFRSELIQEPTEPVLKILFVEQDEMMFDCAIPITPEGTFNLPSGALAQNLYLEILGDGLLFGYKRDYEMLFLIIHLSGDVEVLANSFRGNIHFENEGSLCIYNPKQYDLANWSIDDGKNASFNCSSLSRDPKEVIEERHLKFCSAEDVAREKKLAKLKRMFDPAAIAGE